MKSVVQRLGTEDFPRIRIGTGLCNDKTNLINYVISKVSNEEYLDLVYGINKATDAVCEFLKSDIDVAMNKINQKGQ